MEKYHPQKESQIEQHFIRHLEGLGYAYCKDIKDRASLEANFRNKFEALNNVRLTDGEFERLMGNIVSSDVYKASKTLRDKVEVVHDDGTTRFYPLVNLQNWCKNDYEVINQLRINTHSSYHRYDVIILINGLPLVQVELKAHGVSPRVAIKQIVDYKNDHENGYEHTLLAFMQLFIVSNEADTFYFANNPRKALTFDEKEQFLPVCRWADEQNKKVANLHEFAREVLRKCTLGELISRYMVLVETERKLLIMRPYQIYAVKKMVECIENNSGNGYIWHTTGSGKTLTSFKAATLLKDNPNIAKCLFVVDRKDLDKQTREEFNKFQKDCVEENTNTGELVRRMLSDEYKDKIIVTTIQKLGLALDKKNQRLDKLRERFAGQRVVFIFDECHRSQFGEYHRAIRDFFPRAQLFGFTGTPIFAENATRTKIEGREASALTTEDIFQKPLHTYAITHAIEDKSVLPFDVSFYRLQRDGSFDTGNVPKKIIVEKILEVHDKVSDNRRFNALFATASINDAIAYCKIFDEIQLEREKDSTYKPLRIACLFSPPAEGNRDIMQIQEELDQERQDNQVDPLGKKEALRRIISMYNQTYNTLHCIEEFDRYNSDVQQRIKWQGRNEVTKEQKIDITIVVDMLLTGFDSKYLNTLYVDKGLQYHGLIQAFSRTNRVLNERKPFGKILDFRAQSADALNTAVELFSGERDKSKDAAKIWLVEPAEVKVEQLEEAAQGLRSMMESHGLKPVPEEVPNLRGDAARANFVEQFKPLQRILIQLDQYVDTPPELQARIDAIISPDERQAFRTAYLELARELRQKRAAESADGAAEPTTVMQDIDLELVLFASAIIDYDYIISLIARMVNEAEPERREVTREEIVALLRSHSNLPEDREDILEFVCHPEVINGRTAGEISDEFCRFREAKWHRQLQELAHRYGVDQEGLSEFIESTLHVMRYDDSHLSDLFTDEGLGWRDRVTKKNALRADLVPLIRLRAAGQTIDNLPADV
ncbi:DEAD/DEAH box helicase [Tannerella sp. oral taxon BU063 isolate Cell 6/7/9]|uniref:Type I restriction enzyme endonuclease subunit n=1 Tax=Tannerella sp. oral taxon BU063 isolate Cell 6/7/9 TaxID=1411021 RepID=W2CSE7_9BACT|nr:DEAD/DEAH box helicase [Tannerella sp. oral taxon BU063 isolate Cell 6/7/9]